METRLEPYRERDLDELLPMWRQSFEHGVGIVDPHPLAERRQYFLEARVGWHRRGIGRQLLEWAQSQSSGSLWLYTFERNAVARRFYEAHGFRAVAHGFEDFWQLPDVRYEWTRRRDPQ